MTIGLPGLPTPTASARPMTSARPATSAQRSRNGGASSRRRRTNVGSTNTSLRAASPSTPGPTHSRSGVSRPRAATALPGSRSRRSASQSLVAATWNRPMLPGSEEWKAESHDKWGKGEHHSLFSYLDISEEKKGKIRDAHNRKLLNRARDRLEGLACTKYGSLRNMFEMFDTDGNGKISLDEFSKGIKRRHLETLFPRDQQRIIFQHIDKNGSDSLDLLEFYSFFDTPAPLDGGGDGRRATPRDDGPAVALDPRVERVKDTLVQKLYQRRKSTKLTDAYKDDTQYLLNCFKQIDQDMSGLLTYPELCAAFGPEHLNLGIKPDEIQLVVDALDSNKDGAVSYKEFIKFLKVNDIDPDYNSFYDSRQREMANLRKVENAPWRWQEQADLAMRRSEDLQRLRESDMIRPVSATPSATDNADRFFATSKSAGPIARGIRAQTSGQQGTRALLSSSQDLFKEMHKTKQMELAAINPRICPAPPTDWTRVGLGGNGTYNDSALYINDRERFNTTAKDHYPPLIYVPNQPVTRAVLSDAEKFIKSEKQRLKTFKKKREHYLKHIMEGVKLREDMKQMNVEQRLRLRAHSMSKYFQKTYDRDIEIDRKKPPDCMQRRKNEMMYTRMWGGCPSSQLHRSFRAKAKTEFSTTQQEIGVGVK